MPCRTGSGRTLRLPMHARAGPRGSRVPSDTFVPATVCPQRSFTDEKVSIAKGHSFLPISPSATLSGRLSRWRYAVTVPVIATRPGHEVVACDAGRGPLPWPWSSLAGCAWPGARAGASPHRMTAHLHRLPRTAPRTSDARYTSSRRQVIAVGRAVRLLAAQSPSPPSGSL